MKNEEKWNYRININYRQMLFFHQMTFNSPEKEISKKLNLFLLSLINKSRRLEKPFFSIYLQSSTFIKIST